MVILELELALEELGERQEVARRPSERSEGEVGVKGLLSGEQRGLVESHQ